MKLLALGRLALAACVTPLLASCGADAARQITEPRAPADAVTGTVAGTPHLVMAGGDGQWAKPGQTLPLPLVVRAVDGSGAPVAGGLVYWLMMAGGGTVTPATSFTDASGYARATWTLGPGTSEQLVQATGLGAGLMFGANSPEHAPIAPPPAPPPPPPPPPPYTGPPTVKTMTTDLAPVNATYWRVPRTFNVTFARPVSWMTVTLAGPAPTPLQCTAGSVVGTHTQLSCTIVFPLRTATGTWRVTQIASKLGTTTLTQTGDDLAAVGAGRIELQVVGDRMDVVGPTVLGVEALDEYRADAGTDSWHAVTADIKDDYRGVQSAVAYVTSPSGKRLACRLALAHLILPTEANPWTCRLPLNGEHGTYTIATIIAADSSGNVTTTDASTVLGGWAVHNPFLTFTIP